MKHKKPYFTLWNIYDVFISVKINSIFLNFFTLNILYALFSNSWDTHLSIMPYISAVLWKTFTFSYLVCSQQIIKKSELRVRRQWNFWLEVSWHFQQYTSIEFTFLSKLMCTRIEDRTSANISQIIWFWIILGILWK